MNKLQGRLLKMLGWFHKYCEDNNITYYAIGGTVLGAARHKGFIPWDDDIDLALPRKDYNKLMDTFKGTIDGYCLETPYSDKKDFLYTFSKLYDTNSTMVEHTRFDCKRGIYIDIFPLDGIGNSFEEAAANMKKFDRKNMLLMMRTCAIRKERKWYKNLSIIMARAVPSFIINEKKLSLGLEKLANSLNDDSAEYLANLSGAYRFKEITKKSVFGNPTLYDFEDQKIYGPQHTDEYLTGVYGNWRQLPPEDKRKSGHDFIFLDYNKSYLD